MTEPSDEFVEQFIEAHPGGARLDDIASAFGVTRQRAQQLVKKAVVKVMKELRWHGIRRCDDVLG